MKWSLLNQADLQTHNHKHNAKIKTEIDDDVERGADGCMVARHRDRREWNKPKPSRVSLVRKLRPREERKSESVSACVCWAAILSNRLALATHSTRAARLLHCFHTSAPSAAAAEAKAAETASVPGHHHHHDQPVFQAESDGWRMVTVVVKGHCARGEALTRPLPPLFAGPTRQR